MKLVPISSDELIMNSYKHFLVLAFLFIDGTNEQTINKKHMTKKNTDGNEYAWKQSKSFASSM